jgi:1-deoxy-D-xylulose-5-phosphate synthase
VAIYSTFLQRAYDNIIHDVALQNLPVTLCIDRSGLNVKDGPTHHGIFDVSFLSGVPGMTVYTPVTVEGLKRALMAALYGEGPSAVRYANVCESERIIDEFYGIKELSAPTVLANYTAEDNPTAVIAVYGNIALEAIKARDVLREKGVEVGIILLEYLKPYGKLADDIAALIPDSVETIVLLEEGIKNGGAAMLIKDRLCDCPRLSDKKIKILAIEDSFVHLEKGDTAYSAAGISADHIVSAITDK